MPHALLVGDPDADPLLRMLPPHLGERGWSVSVVRPLELAGLPLTVEADACAVGGRRIQGIVFRLSPRLLVAPGYDPEDAGFALAELRAAWLQVLAQPRIVAMNRPDVDGWFASSEWSAWRRRLTKAGVTCAPRRIGTPFPAGWWVRWSGHVAQTPDARVAQRLGSASVEAGPLRTVLCCAGGVVAEPALDVRGSDSPLASALLAAGLVLAEAVVDSTGRLVTLSTLPAISEALSNKVAAKVAEWMDAAARR